MQEGGSASRADRVQLWLGVVGIVAAAVLVVTGALNRSLQTQVAAGQAKIANAQAAANVNNTLIRLLAKSAAETNDAQIRTLLAQNGITFQQGAAQQGAATGLTAPAAPTVTAE